MGVVARGQVTVHIAEQGESPVMWSLVPTPTSVGRSEAGVCAPASASCRMRLTVGSESEIIGVDKPIEYRGRNLIKSSKTLFCRGTDFPDSVFMQQLVIDGERIGRIERTSLAQLCYGYALYREWMTAKAEPNTDYVWSIDVKSNCAGRVYFDVRGGYDNKFSTKFPPTNNQWVRISGIMHVEELLPNADFGLFLVENLGNVGDIVDYRNPKVERGTKATPWSPAPEDHALTLNGNPYTAGANYTIKPTDTELLWAGSLADPVRVSIIKDGATGGRGIQGIKGADGTQYYTWIRYSDNANGVPSDNDSTRPYIGIAVNKLTPTESDTASDYMWSKITGDKGIKGDKGADGKQLYTWMKYADTAQGSGLSDSAVGKAYIGFAYNKLTATESTTPSDYLWSKIKGDVGDSVTGKMLYRDPEFRQGINSCYVYNNSGNGNVVISRISKPADCPTTSTHCLEIKVTGIADPAHGGFCQLINSRANAVFLQKIVAKVPVGYTLNITSNPLGNGSTDEFITPRVGTGKYETYLRKTVCGTTGSFATGGFVYLEGSPQPTPANPLVWQIASCTCYDLTDSEKYDDAIKAAQDAAAAAASVATQTQSAINAMNDDRIFDLTEKQTTRTKWEAIHGVASVDNTAPQGGGSCAKVIGMAGDRVSTAELRRLWDDLRYFLAGTALYANNNTGGFNRSLMASKFANYYNEEIAVLDRVSKSYTEDIAYTIAGRNHLMTSRYDDAGMFELNTLFPGTARMVSDPELGAVVEYSRLTGTGDFMTNHKFIDLPNQDVVYYVIAKPIANNTAGECSFNFGGWNHTAEGLTSKSEYINLGNGWRQYFSTFKSSTTLTGAGANNMGINSVTGTWQFYAAGILKGKDVTIWEPAREDIQTRVDNFEYLKETFQSNVLSAGVVLGSFIGVEENNVVKAGMSNGKDNIPFLFAKSDGVKNAASAAFTVDKKGIVKQRGADASVTVNNGQIVFDRISNTDMARSMVITPALADVGVDNTPLLPAMSGSAGTVSKPLYVARVYSNTFFGQQNINLTDNSIALTDSFEMQGGGSVLIPSMTFQLMASASGSEGTISCPLKVQLESQITGMPVGAVLSLEPNRSFPVGINSYTGSDQNVTVSYSCLGVGLSPIPAGVYKLVLKMNVSIALNTADPWSTVSVLIKQTTTNSVEANWGTSSTNSKIFGNGLVYSSVNGSYGGMITTPNNTVLMVQNPDSGFRVDNMGVARQSKDGRRWDYGGLLLTARVNQNTTINFECGIGKIGRIAKGGYGVYIVYHDLGSANYTVTASIWLDDFSSDVISIGNITPSSFTIRMTNNSYQPVEQPFMFQMFGY